MEDLLYYTKLFDIYGKLLTKKQQDYFKDYYFENFTLDEIANNDNVSKAAASKNLKSAKENLENYENILHILKKKTLIKKEFENESEILSRIEKYDNILM
jgi:predicted DNA-binding protein YlxM (UPF0122 family)